MAKETKADADATETAAPPKKSKKLLIIILIVVLLLVILGGGVAFLLIKKNKAQDGEEAKAAVEKTKQAPPVYVPLDAFTVNLVPENGEQFLQVLISVEVADAHVADTLKLYTPKLRNNVMLLLSSKKASELVSREGKENLAKDIRDLMNKVLGQGGGDHEKEPPVREVLFTSFIIQ